jgi:hypothetical protein
MKAFALVAIAAATTFFGHRFATSSDGATRTASAATTSADGLCLAQGYHAQAIDRIIGDGGLNRVYPIYPRMGAEGTRLISRRLEYIENLLRSRDVANWPEGLRAERMRNIERLHAYRLRQEYPVNYDHPDSFLPTFMDRDGKICAAGYLIEQSAGHDFAVKVNNLYQYASIRQMKSPAVDKWIAASGLTRKEVETIQVIEMRYEPEPNQNVAAGGNDSTLVRVNVPQVGRNGFSILGGRGVETTLTATVLDSTSNRTLIVTSKPEIK